MKFYDCVTAPSPRRVRIFLAEKGLTVPTVQVDLRNGEQFTPAFRALNPDCMVPVLELDSGAAITDIIAICRYFEELHPDPPLMGRSAEERAIIESWLRRIEWDGIYAAQEAFRNATPGLKGRALPGQGSRGDSAYRFQPELLALAKYPNVAVKATGQVGYAEDAYPFRSLHQHLHRCFDAFGPARMFWGTDITRMPCSWRQCVTVFTEELPWLQGRDKELVMGEAVCNWVGWSRPA